MMADDPGPNADPGGARVPPGVITLPSAVGVDELLRRVVARVEERGLDIFTVIDHSGEADEVGLALPDTKVVMFGSPRAGTPIMRAHPLIALDLPLRLLIWTDVDDRAFVSYNAPAYLSDRFGLSSREADALRAVENIAAAVVAV